MCVYVGQYSFCNIYPLSLSMLELEYFYAGLGGRLAFEERMETGNVVFAIWRNLNRSSQLAATFHCDAHLAKVAVHVDVDDLTALAVQDHIPIELLRARYYGADAGQLGDVAGHGD